MKSVFSIFWQFIRCEQRDRYSLFWNFAFPLIVMTILVLVFGNMNTAENTVVFQVGLVNQETELASGNELPVPSQIMEDLLVEISHGERSWLQLHQISQGQTIESFLSSELHQLERGNRHAVLVIPDALNESIYQEVMSVLSPQVQSHGGGEVVIYSQSGNQMSAISVDILSQIVSGINSQINTEIGLIDTAQMVDLHYYQVETDGGRSIPFNFANYLMPGIFLMVFLSSGLELVVERLALYRERGILRRYFAAPLQPAQYGLGLLMHIMVLSILQVLLVYGFGVSVFGVSIPLFTPLPLFYLLFSLTTLLSLGWLIAAVSKTANSALTLANALLYPLMFLGGLYFPVMDMPLPIQLFVQGNPVTYLVNGFRDSLGVFPSPTPALLNLLVPSLWLVTALALGFSRFKWDAKGGN